MSAPNQCSPVWTPGSGKNLGWLWAEIAIVTVVLIVFVIKPGSGGESAAVQPTTVTEPAI
mgnify:CR=1 FL=1